ncbi:hypothetical protein DMUE_5987, partial [Dictyocoela muelleri]
MINLSLTLDLRIKNAGEINFVSISNIMPSFFNSSICFKTSSLIARGTGYSDLGGMNSPFSLYYVQQLLCYPVWGLFSYNALQFYPVRYTVLKFHISWFY